MRLAPTARSRRATRARRLGLWRVLGSGVRVAATRPAISSTGPYSLLPVLATAGGMSTYVLLSCGTRAARLGSARLG